MIVTVSMPWSRIRRLLAMAVALAVWATAAGGAAAAPPRQALCTVPTVSMTANTTVVDANAPTATLTMTLSSALCGGYALSLYDNLGTRIWYSYSWGTSPAAINVAPPNNQTRTYTAYVAKDVPIPGPPVVSVASTSSVAVQNVGWIGSLTMTANRTQTDANNTTAALTMTLDRPLAGPYYLSLYDHLGNRVWYSASWGTTPATINVAPPNNESRTYTAYVSQDVPVPGPPVNDVRRAVEITVTNAGWLGTLQLTSNRDSVDSSNPTAGLTMVLDRPLASPYLLSLYDSTGTRIWYASSWDTTPVTRNVNPPLNQTRTYTAYVSQDVPVPGQPITDISAVASITFTNGVITAETMQRINLTWLVDQLVNVTDEEIVLRMCASPAATHLQGSSVCDQGLAFLAARAASLSRKVSLAKAAAVGGAASILAALVAQSVIAPPEPTPIPQTPAPPAPSKPPTVRPPLPLGIGGELSYEDWLTNRYMEQNPNLDPDDARVGAQQCIALVTSTIERGVDLYQFTPGGQFPCHSIPIFFPGRRLATPAGQPAPTADHDWDAIFASGGYLPWIKLNWVTRQDRIDSGLGTAWYNGLHPCTETQTGQHCDEYPFFASAQSGPAAFSGAPLNASLRNVTAGDNQSQGAKLRAFAAPPAANDKGGCGLTSGGTNAATAAAIGSPYLVIPLPTADAPPTFWVCQSGL